MEESSPGPSPVQPAIRRKSGPVERGLAEIRVLEILGPPGKVRRLHVSLPSRPGYRHSSLNTTLPAWREVCLESP